MNTMNSKKFDLLTNSYIKSIRNKCHSKLLKSFENKNDNRKFNPKRFKIKYIEQLILYNIKYKDYSKTIYKREIDSLIGTEHLRCQEDWPLCLYDHTFKNRCIPYFVFKTKGEDEFIDDYLIKETNKIEEEYKEESPYNKLLIERNKHYCTDKEFVNKILKLLRKKGGPPSAFPKTLTQLPFVYEKNLINTMENYIDHIHNLDIGSCESDEESKEKDEKPDINEKKNIINSTSDTKQKSNRNSLIAMSNPIDPKFLDYK